MSARFADKEGVGFDRRGGARYRTVFKVGVLQRHDFKELCLIRDISAGGLRARVYRYVPVGDMIEIEMNTGHVLRGVVVWERDMCVGVQFAGSIDLEAILATQDLTLAGKRIRSPRMPVDCHVTMRLDGRLHNGRLCDISQGGAKVRTALPLASRGDIVLMLPGFTAFHGSAQWIENDLVGLSLNRSIAFEPLVRWIRRYPALHSLRPSPPKLTELLHYPSE